MNRRHPKRKTGGGRFARLPCSVLDTEAVTSLSHAAFRILVLLAAQYHGGNNGALGLTRSQAAVNGIVSNNTLYRALAALEERGLVEQTYTAKRYVHRQFQYVVARRFGGIAHPHGGNFTDYLVLAGHRRRRGGGGQQRVLAESRQQPDQDIGDVPRADVNVDEAGLFVAGGDMGKARIAGIVDRDLIVGRQAFEEADASNTQGRIGRAVLC